MLHLVFSHFFPARLLFMTRLVLTQTVDGQCFSDVQKKVKNMLMYTFYKNTVYTVCSVI